VREIWGGAKKKKKKSTPHTLPIHRDALCAETGERGRKNAALGGVAGKTRCPRDRTTLRTVGPLRAKHLTIAVYLKGGRQRGKGGGKNKGFGLGLAAYQGSPKRDKGGEKGTRNEWVRDR